MEEEISKYPSPSQHCPTILGWPMGIVLSASYTTPSQQPRDTPSPINTTSTPPGDIGFPNSHSPKEGSGTGAPTRVLEKEEEERCLLI